MTTEVTRQIALDIMQICVPADWTDDQVRAFADREYPCGTEAGWKIRRSGAAERVPCASRGAHVHIVLDA